MVPVQQDLSAQAGQTVISPDTTVEGKIHAKGELRVEGNFRGEIHSSSRVVVGQGGKVEATIEAKSMVISGQVVGNLHISERLELLSTGEIFGDLETQPGALIIEKGAKLEGRCTMGAEQEVQATPRAVPVPTAPREDKKPD